MVKTEQTLSVNEILNLGYTPNKKSVVQGIYLHNIAWENKLKIKEAK